MLTEKTCLSIDSMLFKILWKNKTEYKRKTLIRNTLEGGVNALDISTLNQIGWIKHCLNADDNMLWFYIPKLIFDKCGGLHFLLACDFNCSKLPIKLASFHKQTLEACKFAFCHIFSPHRSFIWNNQNVLRVKKSVF